MKSINLFCLPFAGGNKYSYRDYEATAPSFVQLHPLEYPGRGSRSNEQLLSDMEDIVNDVYGQMQHLVSYRPYAVYGHSMGGITAYLLVQKLIRNKHEAPVHLFITGTMGPSAHSRSEKQRHLMSREKFIEEIKRLDGLPEEILAQDELIDYFEPILRADFKATENYVYRPAAPLDIPVTVITGTEETMDRAEIQLWQKETTREVDFRTMPGKHFFIFKQPAAITNIISDKLKTHTKIIHYE
ncbi:MULTISPECIES: thioesterase II family protein [Niastella]|uniref:Thioesterase n=1 Tax=Niastella soli TaxID=2821487 RepID=A0ABS3Z5T6_9BACT|nr:alpha/beta fold hydrolase [Niastella soli]MBO9205535.1 thioesterase [Niastella soli]